MKKIITICLTAIVAIVLASCEKEVKIIYEDGPWAGTTNSGGSGGGGQYSANPLVGTSWIDSEDYPEEYVLSFTDANNGIMYSYYYGSLDGSDSFTYTYSDGGGTIYFGNGSSRNYTVYGSYIVIDGWWYFYRQ